MFYRSGFSFLQIIVNSPEFGDIKINNQTNTTTMLAILYIAAAICAIFKIGTDNKR